ncbi:MAG: T9SS type A sorting domain-containing protein [Ignavibacteria bacterium]
MYDSSNTSGDYVDDAEAFNESGLSDPPPPDNLFYYVKAQDNSYQVSISSDTIGYPTIVCPGCAWEAGDNFTVTNIPSNETPIEYSVKNYPNPFNPVTQIYFNIPIEGNVKITVFNVAGQKVSELLNEYKSPGSYRIDFNGNNYTSGVYYYRIEAGSFTQVNKMILLK